MAKENIEDDATYLIKLSKPATYKRLVLQPQHKHWVKGRVIPLLGDAVAMYEKVEDK